MAKFVLRKSILNLLTAAEARESAGDKVTRMGRARRSELRETIAEAVEQGAGEESIARRLKRKLSVAKEDRDWDRVARTEYWDMANRAALDLILATLGPKAKVVRPTDPSGNIQCKEFGCVKLKVFEAGRIPERLKGSVHVNCNCGPWKSVDMPELTEKAHPAASIPPGIVKRVRLGERFEAFISNGRGRWSPLSSVEGKATMRALLRLVPLVEVGEWQGFTRCRHGFGKPEKSYRLLSLLRLGNAEFYQLDPVNYQEQEGREFRMKHKHSYEEYEQKILVAMPEVALMPEYWTERPLRHFADFLGYKTIADFFVLVPQAAVEQATIGRYSVNRMSPRRAVRRYLRQVFERPELTKHARVPSK